ncbi:hypothetical protein M407DRAFT_12440 [Tulasnella calospora MUT 4182]|uniref:Uncharacterized protein n=1 Tax=Tulasnella calospora MUT 4182 TaxID=1051891 RepID=A0A0C3Q3L0_9AGAM|nr:hypothetical protein M407DRAFT_12440 [Tulasnella calospora MUT 4182]
MASQQPGCYPIAIPEPEPFREPDDSPHEVQFPEPDLSSSGGQTGFLASRPPGNEVVPSSGELEPSGAHQDIQVIKQRGQPTHTNDFTEPGRMGKVIPSGLPTVANLVALFVEARIKLLWWQL